MGQFTVGGTIYPVNSDNDCKTKTGELFSGLLTEQVYSQMLQTVHVKSDDLVYYDLCWKFLILERKGF